MKTKRKTRSKRQRGGEKQEIQNYLLNRVNDEPHLIDLSDDLTEIERVRLITHQMDDLQSVDNHFTGNHTIRERIDNLFTHISSQNYGNWYKIAFYLVVIIYLMKTQPITQPIGRPIGGRKTKKSKKSKKSKKYKN